MYSSKVQLFWEGHKNVRNRPYGFEIYLVNVKTIRTIAHIFVAFSEKLNFKKWNALSEKKPPLCSSLWQYTNTLDKLIVDFYHHFAAGLHSIVLYGTEPERDAPASPSSSVASTDLTLFIGLIVAFIIFLVVVICMIKILRNKSVPHPTYNLASNPGTGGKNFFRFLFISDGLDFAFQKSFLLWKSYLIKKMDLADGIL